MIELLEPLQEEEQLKLFKEYEQGKSQAIREKLILHNLKLVAWTVRKYYDTNILEYDDYFQIGTIGLMRALKTYNYRQGAFSTYSIYWIRQAIERDIQNFGRTIRVPSHMLESISKIKAIKEILTGLLERTPTPKEISLKAGISLKEVNEILKIIDDPVSLNMLVGENKDTTLEDSIKDDSLTPDLLAENKIFIEEFKAESRRALTELEYNIVVMYLGIGTIEHTLREVTSKLNYTNIEKVRNIRDRAMNKLRRTRYIQEVWETIEERTIYYRSMDYSQPMVSGGLPSSSVENIVLDRERQLEHLDRGDFKR